ncbi:hypothetical protein Tco_0643257 [Tanacetum coccineum]
MLNPLTSLNERNQKYEWSVEQEEKRESEIKTSKRNDIGSPKWGIQARERTRRKAAWFRSTDGKKRRQEFVLYGLNLGSIGRKCNGWGPCIKIGESSLTGLELVQETTNKVVLVKEKSKLMRDRQKSYVDYKRKPLEFEVGDQGIIKGVALEGRTYRLRLPKELSSVLDIFHVSNLKKCLADVNLHVPLNEIKVDKTLRFVEEPVEIMDREIKKLKHRNIALVKVRWNSKRGPEFTWEHEDQMRIKYPQLFVDRVVKPAS